MGDFEATGTLGIVATSVASLSVLMLVVAVIVSAMPVVAVAMPDLASVYAACKMLGWAGFFWNQGSVLGFVAFVLSALAKANGALVGWIVCGMGVALFAAVNIFFATTWMALLPLSHLHQHGWYLLAFAPDLALSNYVMGRKSLREGADIQLTKMLGDPYPRTFVWSSTGDAKEA